MDTGELKNQYFMEMSFRYAGKVHGRRASALGSRVRVFKA
jgi:hypothetical protein